MRDGGGRGHARGSGRGENEALGANRTMLLLLERAREQGEISALWSLTCFRQEEDAVQDVLSSTTLQLLSLSTRQPGSSNLLLSHAEKVFF